MTHTSFELDVRLREIEPAIWRTIEVPGGSTLEDVHYAIQVAMGWTNSHLHQFTIGDTVYGMAVVDEEGDLEDEREFRLQDLVSDGASFLHEYDFGDGWEHDVMVKKISTVPKTARPRCTAGARACPPEDCGGVGGYEDLLRAIADPEHEDHENSVVWAGDFQPERFAIPGTGRDLRHDIERLKVLAEDGDELEAGFDPEDDDVGDLPRPLLEAVLGLEPMQRAALAAVIAGSLAEELTEYRSVVDQAAATHVGKPRKNTRARRRRRRGR